MHDFYETNMKLLVTENVKKAHAAVSCVGTDHFPDILVRPSPSVSLVSLFLQQFPLLYALEYQVSSELSILHNVDNVVHETCLGEEV